MAYLIKPDELGFSRVDASGLSKQRKESYEDDGYREVDELEFILANLLTRYTARRVRRLIDKLADEMGEAKEG